MLVAAGGSEVVSGICEVGGGLEVVVTPTGEVVGDSTGEVVGDSTGEVVGGSSEEVVVSSMIEVVDSSTVEDCRVVVSNVVGMVVEVSAWLQSGKSGKLPSLSCRLTRGHA